MSFNADELEQGAVAATGLSDFGSNYYREGLERIVDSINTEADINDMGHALLTANISSALMWRLKIVDTYRQHPEIADEVIGGPVFVIGLPRTGTTALSQLVGADSQFRSLRMWESQQPTPPPELATQHTDPRIAEAQAGIDALDRMFPLMKTMQHAAPTMSSECHDLMSMSFRTFHFDGVVRVPRYLEWVLNCDMRGTYTFHEQVLKLLQWHCPPTLWHLRTPVHMYSIDALVDVYPNAKFLWSHRDPAEVMASVCSLISYVRSWSSDRNDPVELGVEMVDSWSLAIQRAMDYRDRLGDDRFADVSFAELQTDPVNGVAKAYAKLGLDYTDEAQRAAESWAAGNKRGAKGEHVYELSDYGLTPGYVREHFSEYLAKYDALA